MVPNLNRANLSWWNRLQLTRKMAGTLFNFRKGAQDPPLCVQDRRAVAILCAGSFPRLENRIF